MVTQVRIALVGVGKIVRDQHLPAIRANGAFALAATVDLHARVDGLPAFADLAALEASDIRIDAVAVCTPPQACGAIARAALAAGWHVLLEKTRPRRSPNWLSYPRSPKSRA
jgi:D-galactose 1-dehydrogenase